MNFCIWEITDDISSSTVKIHTFIQGKLSHVPILKNVLHHAI